MGRSGGLETTLRALRQGNVDVGFLQEKKLTQGIHTRHDVGYGVWAAEVESRYRGRVAVFWRAAKVWKVKNTDILGPNMVSFLLTSGERRWYVVGVYMPPNDVPDVHCVEQALQAAPKRLEMILMGDLNARLGKPRDECEKDLATAPA